jgi:hypothetical protein
VANCGGGAGSCVGISSRSPATIGGGLAQMRGPECAWDVGAGILHSDLRSSRCDVYSVVPRSALMPYTTAQISLGSCKTGAWRLEGCRLPGLAVCGYRCTGSGYILARRISTSPSGCRVRSSNVFWQCIPGCGICLGPAIFRGASTSDWVSQSVLYTTHNHHHWLARRAQDLH